MGTTHNFCSSDATRMADSPPPNLYAPRYWPTWIGMGLLWLVARLASYPVALGIGRRLGRIAHRLAAERRHISEVNLTLCFPELSAQQRQALLREHFEALGITIVMMGFSWWGSDDKLRRLSHINGLEKFEPLLSKGKGILLVGMHFVDLDLIGRLLGLRHPFGVVYRQHENPVIEQAFSRYRKERFSAAIRRSDVRSVLRALKENQVVWIAPDQAMKGKHTVLAPFFGIPASTTTIVSRIARISGAPVVFIYGYRLPGEQGYVIEIGSQIEDFPGDSMESDTQRINLMIEQAARVAPAQYLWSHRRFKRRPGLPDPY